MLCWTSSHQYERVRAITPNLTHLLPIHTWDLVTLTSHMTHRREKMANWAQFGHFHLGVYSLLWPAVSILMGVSYFEGTENLLCYTSCTLTTLHCSKVLFLQCYHMKRYNKIFKKMWGVYSLLWDTVTAFIHMQRSTFWLIEGSEGTWIPVWQQQRDAFRKQAVKILYT